MSYATYTRLYADAAGASRFETVELPLTPTDFAPPAAPLHIAPFVPVVRSLWVGAPVGWAGDIPHPSPQRQVFCTLQGEYEVTASDGTVRHFSPGSVLLLEDTWGQGHVTRITSSVPVLIFAAVLAEAA